MDVIVAEVLAVFRSQKELAERAIAQVDDASLHAPVHPEINSIAVVMRHLAGNMISRWTDFLTTDGEKPDRHRDGEFIDLHQSRAEILAHWERGWGTLFATLESLGPEDLSRTITIRGEPHTVIRALLRQVSHYGYHVGQIVTFARYHADDRWTTLSVPRGGSVEFNRATWHGPRPDHVVRG